MHEYSLVQSLLDQVESIRLAERADRVLSVRVNIGEFCGVEPELFRAAFDCLVDTTPARGAQLEMKTTRLEARCQQCGHSFAVPCFLFVCPDCGSQDVVVTQGEGMILETIELEQTE